MHNLSPYKMKCETKTKSLRNSLGRKPNFFRLIAAAKAKAEDKPKIGVTLAYLLTFFLSYSLLTYTTVDIMDTAQ